MRPHRRHRLLETGPDLAPIFDNGGPTCTQALSPEARPSAIPPDSGCPHDARGTARPSTAMRHRRVRGRAPRSAHGVDGRIGERHGTPPTLLGHDQPRRRGGGFHFVYGPRPATDDSTRRGRRRRGLDERPRPRRYRVSTPAPPTTTGSGRQRDRFHPREQRRAVHDPADAPSISNVSVDSVTDTTATIDFTIDPEGSDTTLLRRVRARLESYGQQTQPVDIGSRPGLRT